MDHYTPVPVGRAVVSMCECMMCQGPMCGYVILTILKP